MKKILIMSIFFAFLAFVPHALAQTNNQGFVPLAGIPGLTQGVQATQGGIASFLNNLYKFLIGAAAVLAVIMIIWGGLEIATNRDNVSKILDSKGRIYNAIFGLVLVLLPVLVFSIINPSILNLSINMSSINLTTPQGSGSSPTSPTPSQCKVNGTPGILQVANCFTSNQATTWGQQNCTDGNLSSIVSITNPSNGVSTYVVTCTGKQDYVFINTPGYFRYTINKLQPLVHYPSRPNNGADAMAFANTCHAANVGFKTCVSYDPTINSTSLGLQLPVSCQLTKNDPSYGTSWLCYKEALTCEDVSWYGNFYTKCTDSPSWTPFQ